MKTTLGDMKAHHCSNTNAPAASTLSVKVSLCVCISFVFYFHRHKFCNLNECQKAVRGYKLLSLALLLGATEQNNVHTDGRSQVIMCSGLEARNKCPCVIDYALQANEINRAWIDSAEVESCQRGICSHVQWLYWHAHIQRISERNQAPVSAEKRAVSSSTAQSCFIPSTAIRVIVVNSNTHDEIWQARYLLLNNHC